jgi:hypothetical protein
MAESLALLETRLGRPEGGSVSIGTARQFSVRWPCGCIATGPTFEALELSQALCGGHPPQRSVVTQRISFTDVSGPTPSESEIA